MSYSKDDIKEKTKIICDKIERGASLRAVLREKNMPATKTFYNWVDGDEEIFKQYARACSIRADVIFEQILEISDSQENDVIINADGEEVTNHNVIARNKLQVDSRKWMLGKMNPKKYGEKLDVTSNEESIASKVELTDKQIDKVINGLKPHGK